MIKDKIAKLAGVQIGDFDKFFAQYDQAGRVNQKFLMNCVKEALKYIDEQENLG